MMRNRSFAMVFLIAALAASSAAWGAASALDDATILAIFDQANAADIVTGRLAAKYGASAVSGAYVVLSGSCVCSRSHRRATSHAVYHQSTRDLCPALNCISTTCCIRRGSRLGRPHRGDTGTSSNPCSRPEPATQHDGSGVLTIVFRLMAELEGLHSYKLERRLSSFLLLRASTDGIVRMTQQEIASHLGTTREVVARALGQLASARRIRTGRRQVVIIDPVKRAEDVKRRKQQHQDDRG